MAIIDLGHTRYVYCMMDEQNRQLPTAKKDLDKLRKDMNLLGLNITTNSMKAMDALLHRMDSIDEAVANKVNLDEASLRELLDASRQTNESLRLRLDILRMVRGYDTDTSVVPPDDDDKAIDNTTLFSEEQAEAFKNEILNRSQAPKGPDVQDAEIVQ